MHTKPTWLERATVVVVSGVLLAILAAMGVVAWVGTRPAPHPAVAAPVRATSCYLRAAGNNAVLEVTGLRAEDACREWQQWSLKDAPNRALAWSTVRPELTYADGTPVRDPVKQTCEYTLGERMYSVTDTGGMSIGTRWCQELYARKVKAG